MFFLDETEMTQNCSVFVFLWKTSSDSCGRLNLRIDMNQATNLKSLGFTWEKYQICWESLQVFDLSISAIFCFVVDGVATLVFLSVVVEAGDSSAPTQRSSLLSPPLLPPLVLENSLSRIQTLVEQMVAVFHPSALLPRLTNL